MRIDFCEASGVGWVCSIALQRITQQSELDMQNQTCCLVARGVFVLSFA